MPQDILKPEFIGRFLIGSEYRFMPVAHMEVMRTAEFFGSVIDTHRIEIGRSVLLVSQFEEAAQFLPLEEALTERGLILTNAEASIYDGNRAASILRRFDVAAVIGLNSALLESLQTSECDVAGLLAGRLVWVRPCAYARLAELEGIELRRWIELGPAVAFECAAGAGAHVDSREWTLREAEGGLKLSSRLARALPIDDLFVGFAGSIERTPCACGLADPRVVPEIA
jgi:hypothetical protein